MVTAGDFRNGVTFDMDGSVMQIIEFQHVKPGKGAAFVRTKLRNVVTGSVIVKKGYAVSLHRWRTLLLHGYGKLRTAAYRCRQAR